MVLGEVLGQGVRGRGRVRVGGVVDGGWVGVLAAGLRLTARASSLVEREGGKSSQVVRKRGIDTYMGWCACR